MGKGDARPPCLTINQIVATGFGYIVASRASDGQGKNPSQVRNLHRESGGLDHPHRRSCTAESGYPTADCVPGEACYRRKVEKIWSRRAPVAPGFPLVASVDARVKSRCLAILVPVRTVTSSASSMRALAWS
jgi:hypothetical protein